MFNQKEFFLNKNTFAQLSFNFKHITVNAFIHTEESLKLL